MEFTFVMAWHERPETQRPYYLFKPPLTKNVKRALARIPWPIWEGQPSIGMKQIAEIQVQLDGWSCPRRVVFVKTLKPANPSAQDVFWGMDAEEVAAYLIKHYNTKLLSPSFSNLKLKLMRNPCLMTKFTKSCCRSHHQLAPVWQKT